VAYSKPAVRHAWAEGAANPADIVDPTDTVVEAGWPQSATPPSRQWFNWVLNWCSNAVRYFMQRGIVDYDAAETYQSGAVVIGNDGRVYQSLVNANIGNTPSTSATQWGPLVTVTPVTSDNSTKVATTAWARLALLVKNNNLSDLGSPSTARSNLGLAAVAASGSAADLSTGVLPNARVQQSNVTQYEAALAINGSQVTGAVANATAAVTATTATTAASATTAGTATSAASATKLSTASGSAPSYSARAFVTFNGGGTVTAGDNVASVTHVATGRFIVNFTTALPSANYAIAPGVLRVSGNSGAMIFIDDLSSPPTTTACPVAHVNQGGLLLDPSRASATFIN
jgi:hypothetical protein